MIIKTNFDFENELIDIYGVRSVPWHQNLSTDLNLELSDRSIPDEIWAIRKSEIRCRTTEHIQKLNIK